MNKDDIRIDQFLTYLENTKNLLLAGRNLITDPHIIRFYDGQINAITTAKQVYKEYFELNEKDPEED